MKTTIKFLLIAVIGVLINSSCSSDDKKEEIIQIEGLWKIVEERFNSIEDNEWAINFPEQNDNIQPYMLFDRNNLYTYYEVKNDEDTLHEHTLTGNYQVVADTLIISYNNVTEKSFFSIKGNELTQILPGTPGEELIITSIKISDLAPPVANEPDNGDENGDPDDDIAPENLEDTHNPNSDPGTFSNPVLINIDQLITSENQNLVDTLDAIISQYRYYLKVEDNKAYNVRVFNVATDFSDLPSRLKYLQVIIADVPYPIAGVNQKEEFRIKETDNLQIGKSSDFTTSTGYIYVEVYRYDNDNRSLHFNIEINKIAN